MFRTLATIWRDNWQWKRQTFLIGYYNLKKQFAGTALGWVWLLVKPTVYAVCFWFTLYIGLRSGRDVGEAPYILWLVAGIWNWFFMQGVLGAGSDVLTHYKYLVKKIKFPICCIPTIYMTTQLITQLVLIAVQVVIYFVCGQPLDIHLIQLPFLIALMYCFWYLVSLSFSLLSAMSRDFAKLIQALSAPFFWISGVIFNVANIDNAAIQMVFNFNPIYTFVQGFRGALYYRTWIWEDPTMCLAFVAVFVATMLFTAFLYHRLDEEVQDAL